MGRQKKKVALQRECILDAESEDEAREIGLAHASSGQGCPDSKGLVSDPKSRPVQHGWSE
jgi:hypothetical protein